MDTMNFAEKMKFDTKNWFHRGIGRRRDSEEISSFLEGVETGVLQALEAVGKYSIARFQANSVGSILDDYIHEELLEMKEDKDA